jgi:hypothetical protein
MIMFERHRTAEGIDEITTGNDLVDAGVFLLVDHASRGSRNTPHVPAPAGDGRSATGHAPTHTRRRRPGRRRATRTETTPPPDGLGPWRSTTDAAHLRRIATQVGRLAGERGIPLDHLLATITAATAASASPDAARADLSSTEFGATIGSAWMAGVHRSLDSVQCRGDDRNLPCHSDMNAAMYDAIVRSERDGTTPALTWCTVVARVDHPVGPADLAHSHVQSLLASRTRRVFDDAVSIARLGDAVAVLTTNDAVTARRVVTLQAQLDDVVRMPMRPVVTVRTVPSSVSDVALYLRNLAVDAAP